MRQLPPGALRSPHFTGSAITLPGANCTPFEAARRFWFLHRGIARLGLKADDARRYLSRMNKPMRPRERAARYRAGLKARGLHRVQMVIPNLRAPAVQARLRAACAKLSAKPETQEMRAIMAFSDAAWADTPE